MYSRSVVAVVGQETKNARRKVLCNFEDAYVCCALYL
jgi:hypothetical protein